MGEILLTWLAKRLGVVMDIDPLYFGTYAADGTLVARLLHSYAIITEEQVNFIEPSSTVSNRICNLRHLQTWLKYISIQLDEQMINNIATEKGADAVRLFYELYLCLENRQSLYIVTQQRGREIYGALKSRFKVMNVPEIAVEDRKESFSPLSIPLAKDSSLIERYREKRKSIVENIKAARRKFLLSSAEQEEFSILPPKLTVPETRMQREIEDVKYLSCSNDINLKDSTYSELLKLQERSGCIQMKHNLDFKSFNSCLSLNKKRSQKADAHKRYKAEMQRIILTDSWDKLEEKKQTDFDNMIAEKLLKQPQYGKQIVTKLYNIKNEKKIIIENKRRLDKLKLQKCQEEVDASFEMDKTALEDYKYDQQFDKEMNIELHRRLYNERMQIKLDMKINMCKNVVNDTIDLAVLIANFREEYDTKIIPLRLWSDWKALWLTSKPMFDQFIAITEVLRSPSNERLRRQQGEEDGDYINDAFDNDDNGNANENYEPVHSENTLENLDSLSDLDLNLYLTLSGIWDQAVINTGENNEKEEKLKLLGYIMHRLLYMKYPQPPLPVVPDLPPFSHAIAVIGLENHRAISILEELLDVHNIRILRLDSVINFCLEIFKKEAKEIEDMGNNLIYKNDIDIQGETLKLDSLIKIAETNSHSSNDIDDKSVTENEDKEILFQEKSVQTPRNVPQDDDILSFRADLGRRAFETLSLGEQLDDALLMEMFVEYLKENDNMKGWVLLNYPLTYSQTIQLEEKLMGIQLPFIEEDSETSEQMQQCLEREVEDPSKNRVYHYVESRLLPNTIPKPKLDLPKTYLTKYITLKKKRMEVEVFDENEVKNIHTVNDKHKLSPVESFYSSQEVFYTFYHDVFDFSTIKHLAKIIVEDSKKSPTNSIELFGENVKDLEIKCNAIEKKGKPSSCNKGFISKQFKMESSIGELKSDWCEETEELLIAQESENALKIKQGSNVFFEKIKKDENFQNGIGKNKINVKEARSSDIESLSVQHEKNVLAKSIEINPPDLLMDTEKSEINKLDNDMNEFENNSSDSPKPIEEEWNYINLVIPESMGICLATLWENVEEVFIKGFRILNRANRIHYNVMHPHINYVKHNVMHFIDRPDKKQHFVTEFQRNYNNIDADLRFDVDIKNELHCRVTELQSKLQEVCDERKNEAESERRRIINEHWIAQEVVTLLNCCVTASQLEINRCADTLLIVQDYYICMLKKLPQKKVIDKIKIPNFQLSLKDSPITNSNKSIETVKRKSFFNILNLGDEYIEYMDKLFIECNQNKPFSTPLHDNIKQITEIAKEYVRKLNNEMLDVLRREEEILNQEETGKGKKNNKKEKTKISTNVKELQEQQTEPITTVDKRLFQEWSEAIINETNRVRFRLAVIYARTILDVDFILEDTINLYSHLRNEIVDCYNREVECVKALCDLLRKAIEAEVPIQQELVLIKDQFFVHPKILLYPPPPEPLPEPIEERITDTEFRICQIQCMMEKLKILAPTGIISERALVYMLQNIIACEPEGHTLPKVWYELKHNEVPKVIEKLYGHDEYVDWKDFLIYGLNFKFPTIHELLELNKQFKASDPEATEVVSHDSYNCIHFHFNDNIPDDPQLRLRLNLGLEFLFALFKTVDNKVNYSALLLYLCKDEDPKVGLAKAISLFTGKGVIANYGEYVASNVLEEILNRQMKESGKTLFSIGREVLSDLITEAMQQTKMVEQHSYINEKMTQQTLHDENDSENARDQNLKVELNSDENINLIDNMSLSDSNTSINIQPSFSSTMQSTDLSLGLKESDFCDTEYAFRAPLDLFLSIFRACMPWHMQHSEFIDGKSLLQGLTMVFDELSHGEDTIYIHQFLNHHFCEKLLSTIHKFKIFDIAEEIKNIIMRRNIDA